MTFESLDSVECVLSHKCICLLLEEREREKDDCQNHCDRIVAFPMTSMKGCYFVCIHKYRYIYIKVMAWKWEGDDYSSVDGIIIIIIMTIAGQKYSQIINSCRVFILIFNSITVKKNKSQ